MASLDGLERIIKATRVVDKKREVHYYSCNGYGGKPLQDMWSQDKFGGVYIQEIFDNYSQVEMYVKSQILK